MKNKNHAISFFARILLVAAAGLLIIVLYTPIWRIELDAPQYPEGLKLEIHANGLKGNVDIINGLNHYIGMKTLHNEDFIEFSILPWCIMFFALAFVLVAIIGKAKQTNWLLGGFILFGVIAIIDFWRWEYNYGHNLNPNAAIVVPGMAYQPPLIGFKQLLNFGAYSIPDTGGWLFIGAGVILLFCVVFEWMKSRKLKTSNTIPAFMAVSILSVTISGCNKGPEPIQYGKDQCHFCKMTITDNRFGAEIVTDKGKVLKYDEINCLTSYLTADPSAGKNAGIYFTDYKNDHQLVPAAKSFLLKSDKIMGPMNGNIIAFDSDAGRAAALKAFGGTAIDWNDLIKK